MRGLWRRCCKHSAYEARCFGLKPCVCRKAVPVATLMWPVCSNTAARRRSAVLLCRWLCVSCMQRRKRQRRRHRAVNIGCQASATPLRKQAKAPRQAQGTTPRGDQRQRLAMLLLTSGSASRRDAATI